MRGLLCRDGEPVLRMSAVSVAERRASGRPIEEHDRYEYDWHPFKVLRLVTAPRAIKLLTARALRMLSRVSRHPCGWRAVSSG
jgi:hypothetical protein